MGSTSATLVKRQKEAREAAARDERSVLELVADRRRDQVVERCDAMIDLMAALFGVPSREIRRIGRTGNDISRLRQIAMYVAHVVFRLSMREVGRGFGRDRTTVLYACHTVEDLRDDAEFDRIVALAERVAIAAFRDRLEG
ncbi:helix-turn-helix domain-containing protein [Aminobacter sp. P9b]|uniref:Chromosomal replication initiation ATPase DnaA n=1 Tax=Aminobacter niigataensis TaxID=83265 RepID=A0ABR6L5D6_9HYPH|nr:helix-turn-helix domain-containing protein [Aminobacter sp. MSH1]AWC24932.1 Chromosomal replication initiator protein DnaA [Aminobacter sp. MSH1]MBB4651838.1 chromosomal replication initiation ATPase DnaA [Aminobacter niigataensis]